jgi:hypothetical protein
MSSKRKKSSGNRNVPLKFEQKLVLNQWILRLFVVLDFDQLAEGV